MTVFTDTRTSRMREKLADLLTQDRNTQNARFSAVFTAGDETLVIAVADRAGDVTVTETRADSPETTNADFGFTGDAAEWELYFDERPVSHASLMTMALAQQVSAGQIPSVVAISGDPERLFANLPIYNAVLEAAISPKGQTR